MTAVAAAVTEDKLVLSGNKCMKEGREEVKGNKELRREYLEWCKESSLDKKEKVKLYEELVFKVCNARFGAVLKAYKDKTIGRQG